MDCADADVMADFYGRLLGWKVTYRDHDYVSMQDPGGGAGLSFQEEPWYQPPVWPSSRANRPRCITSISRSKTSTPQWLTPSPPERASLSISRAPDLASVDPAGHPIASSSD